MKKTYISPVLNVHQLIARHNLMVVSNEGDSIRVSISDSSFSGDADEVLGHEGDGDWE